MNLRSAVIIVGAIGIGAVMATGAAGMYRVAALLGAAVAGLLLSELDRRRRIRRIRPSTESEFLQRYRTAFQDPPELVAAARDHVATVLRVPVDRLLPEADLTALDRDLSFLGDFEVALADLEMELMEMRKVNGLPSLTRFPRSVAELIHEFVISGPRRPQESG